MKREDSVQRRSIDATKIEALPLESRIVAILSDSTRQRLNYHTVMRGDRPCLRPITVLLHEIAWVFAQRPFLKPTAQAIRIAKNRLAATSL